MNEQRMIYRPDGCPVSFEWSGGAYIDIFPMETGHASERNRVQGEGWHQRQQAAGNGVAFAIIGVWDYSEGKPTIPVTRKAMVKKCDDWLAENREYYGL